MSWEEFGRALAPFEGRRFRLIIEDPSVDLRAEPEPTRSSGIVPSPTVG